MVFITGKEILDLFIMSFGIGFIFTGIIKFPTKDPLTNPPSFFKDLMFATAIAAPGIVLHELGHKFVAMGFGLTATFHTYYQGLAIGVILKALTGWIFFIPGYVAIAGASIFESAISAFAGPLMNLALAGVCMLIYKYKKDLSHNVQIGLIVSKKLNFFLFGFNMLPFPPFDGHKVFYGLYTLFQGLI